MFSEIYICYIIHFSSGLIFFKSGPYNIPNMTKPPIPDFKNPPVIEVVCGVQFARLPKLIVPYFGMLWEKYKREYSICEQTTPIQPTFERFGGSSNISLTLSETPPLPRIWFVNQEDDSIIQVQQDRFLHNWRKRTPDDQYPRYNNVIEKFKVHYSTFLSFIGENGIGSVKPNQLEMTYVNHIPKGEGWESLGDIGNVFKDFNWNTSNREFLPEIDDLNIRFTFKLPNDEGRLHIKVFKGLLKESGKSLLRLDVAATGMPKDNSNQGMWNWFDQARQWIVRGFADFTDSEIQKTIWNRTA